MLEKLPQEIGQALQGQRAGIEDIAFNHVLIARVGAHLDVHSPSFVNGTVLPVRFTADGEGTSPALAWRDVPASASCVVLIVEDADSPTPHPLVHAIAVNLPTRDELLPEGALTTAGYQELGLDMGLNSYLTKGWLPPDPPPGHGVHRYAFQFFALRAGPQFSAGPGRAEVLNAILERAVAAGCLIATYERPAHERVHGIATDEPGRDSDLPPFEQELTPLVP
jgi:Raf kinase inhibitor-like YbhB/YbcL family protein